MRSCLLQHSMPSHLWHTALAEVIFRSCAQSMGFVGLHAGGILHVLGSGDTRKVFGRRGGFPHDSALHVLDIF